MRARNSLSEVQREHLVALFEHSLSCTAAARRVDVGLSAARILSGGLSFQAGYASWSNQPSSSMIPKRKRKLPNASLQPRPRWNWPPSLVYHPTNWSAARFGHGAMAVMRHCVRIERGRPQGSMKSKLVGREDRLRRRGEQAEAENAYLKKLRDVRSQWRG